MSKRDQNARTKKNELEPVINPAPTPTDPTAGTSSAHSTQSGTEDKGDQKPDSARGVAAIAAGKLVIKGAPATDTEQKLVDKLLIEGSTFEGVVETANELGAPSLTVNAVKTYFQGNQKLQADRVHYMVDTSESLLKGLGDPESAEARLAQAAILTGLMNLHQDTPQMSLKDAEHARIAQANLNLKHRLVVAQRDKARQALQYSKERTRLLVLAQEKVTEQIAILQQDAKRQQAGEPLGPAMLQRIQQIYGLTSQMPDGGRGDAAKA